MSQILSLGNHGDFRLTTITKMINAILNIQMHVSSNPESSSEQEAPHIFVFFHHIRRRNAWLLFLKAFACELM